MIRLSNALLICTMILVLGGIIGSIAGCAEFKEALPELVVEEEQPVASAPMGRPMPPRQAATLVKPADIRAENCQLLKESYGFPLAMSEGDSIETQRRDAGLNNAYMCTCLKVMERPDGLICKAA